MFNRRIVLGISLLAITAAGFAIYSLPPSNISSNLPMETSTAGVVTASPARDKPEGLLDGVLEGRTTLFTVGKMSIIKHTLTESDGRLVWEGHAAAIQGAGT